MKKVTRLLIATALLIGVLTVCGCGKAEEIPVPDPNLEVLEYTMVAADAAALQDLDVYVNLQKLDLRGSDCYEAIEAYIAAHPQVQVIYDVKVGNERYSPDVKQLNLKDGSFQPEELCEELKHLPLLTVLELPGTSLSAEQIQSIADAYPELNLVYTVEILGQEVASDLTELDLSGLTPADVNEELVSKLQMLPELSRIQLMDATDSSNFAPADVKNLMETLPDVTVAYSFQLFGQTVTTEDERVEFVKVDIGNEGIPEIRAALDILPACTYFLMDTCGVDNEVMAQLRDDYPNTKVVWRVFWGKYHDLTDVEMIHCNGGVNTKNSQVLKYCTDVVYLDLGHNADISSIEFINYMPKLKICIIADSTVSDLSPIANCPDLEWLEIVCCMRVSDLSPIANCTKLRGINLSMAYSVTDITPLFGLQNLERLYIGRSSVKKDQYEAACEALPNCWVSKTWYEAKAISPNYAVGWRLEADYSKADWYEEVCRIFRYAEGFYNGKPE